MKQSYFDIREKLGNPLWWDEVGCPRYAEFHPELANNIYARQCCLLLIKCQACRHEFKVAMTYSLESITYGRPMRDLITRIKNKSIHYGDPPNVGCCASGPTMNCDDVSVIQMWERRNCEWVRSPELEVGL